MVIHDPLNIQNMGMATKPSQHTSAAFLAVLDAYVIVTRWAYLGQPRSTQDHCLALF